MLSERIQTVLDEQQLDQPALGKVAGVTKATVNQWLLGKIKSLKMEYAVRIQERYGYNTSWLVLGTGPKKGLSEEGETTAGGEAPRDLTVSQNPAMEEAPLGVAEPKMAYGQQAVAQLDVAALSDAIVLVKYAIAKHDLFTLPTKEARMIVLVYHALAAGSHNEKELIDLVLNAA
ncbi:helix-turn-helix domain-containing protein (plasmid) [Ralstonia syzygii subsp. celebesensis]